MRKRMRKIPREQNQGADWLTHKAREAPSTFLDTGALCMWLQAPAKDHSRALQTKSDGGYMDGIATGGVQIFAWINLRATPIRLLLLEVAHILQLQARVDVIIEGHTDSQGEDDRNLELSQQRAESVLEALVERGIDTTRLRAVGYGEQRPLESNDTARGRAANRRVDFMFTQHQDKPEGASDDEQEAVEPERALGPQGQKNPENVQ